MPDHYREIFQHAPLVAVGMVVGQADALLERTPLVIKYTAAVAFAVSLFFNMKADLKSLEANQMLSNAVSAEQMVGLATQMENFREDHKMFMEFMNKGDRCTKESCDRMRSRVDRIEEKLLGISK